MVRKLFIGGALLAAGAACVYSSSTGRWLAGTTVDYVRSTITGQIPFDVRIQMAEKGVEELGGALERKAAEIYDAERSLAKLNDRIAKTESDVNRFHDQMAELHNEATNHFASAGEERDQDRVQRELARKLNLFRDAKETLVQLNELKVERDDHVSAVRDQFERIEQKRRAALVKIDELKARHERMKAEAITEDDSPSYEAELNALEGLLDEMDNDLEKSARVKELMSGVEGVSSEKEAAPANLLDEVAKELGRPEAQAGTGSASGDDA